MRRISPLLVVLLLLVTSCGATLKFQWTTPFLNNDAACGATPVTSTGADSVWSIWRVPTASIADSVFSVRGQVISKSYTRPAGTYAVTVTVARVVNGVRFYSCPFTGNIEAPAPPDAVTVSP